MSALRLALIALFATISTAFAQAPPPIPALPDTPRITTYALSANTCNCSVGFALYGDSTDYWDWVEVWVNGVNIPYNGTSPWTITSPTGQLSTIPRPITDGVLTFSTPVTGTVEIVGARRPRRVSQFSESRGVPARDLNQALTDIVAQNRETWDKINDVSGRGLFSQPGVILNTLPLPSTCANGYLGFDNTGINPICLFPVNIAGSTTMSQGILGYNGAGTGTPTALTSLPANINVLGTNPTALVYGGKCDGSTNDAAAFVAADAAATGNIYVPYTGHACIIGSTISLNHQVLFAPGALISVSSTFTLTLTKPPLASPTQTIFTTGGGTVAIDLAPGYGVYPEWWGCVANGSVDCTAATNAAVNSIVNTTGGSVVFSVGTYELNCSGGNAVTIRGASSSDFPVTIIGQGLQLTNFKPSTNCGSSLFYVNQIGSYGDFRNFTILSPYSVANFGGITFASTGLNTVDNLQFYNIGYAINCAGCNDMWITHLYIQNCGANDCLTFGGGPLDHTGSAHVSLIHLRDIEISENNAAAVNCIRIDSGANAMTIDRTILGTCVNGIYQTNTYASTGGHRPEDIGLYNIESDVTVNNINILAGWSTRINNPYLGASTGSGILLDSTFTGKADYVDGTTITGGYIRGGGIDGIAIVNAANVAIGGNVVISGNSITTPGAGAGVHAYAGSAGSLTIKGSQLGGIEFADQSNTQGYSVALDNGSMATISTCGAARNVTCTGSVDISGNNMVGNITGAILDNGASPTGVNKRFTDNAGYNGTQAAFNATLAASPATLTFPYPWTAYVSGGTVSALTVGGSSPGIVAGTIQVAAGQSLVVTYTGVPTIKVFPQ